MISKTHRYQLTILESHLDFFGHVNNAVYFQILEQARWEWITEHGYGAKEINETGIGPVILEAHIKFKKELVLRQKVFIDTTFSSFEKTVSKVHQRIIGETSQLFCEAEFTFGLFDIHARKLVPPTKQWLNAFGIEKKTDLRV